MVQLEIPEFGKIELECLVMDFNGTLAVDGELQPGVADRLRILSTKLSLYVVTADTFKTARKELHQLPVEIVLLKSADDQARVKEKFVEDLGPKQTAAIGNGRNDRQMLAKARLGVAVVLREGVSSATLGASDIIATGIEDALDLFIHPMRLRATLRG